MKDYLEARLPGLKKQVGYWYPANPGEFEEVPGNRYGTLIVPSKHVKNLALPTFSGDSYLQGQTVTDGQIFLITCGTEELYFMQVTAFNNLRINRSGEFVFHDVVAKDPDNLDVLNYIHLAKVLNRR